MAQVEAISLLTFEDSLQNEGHLVLQEKHWVIPFRDVVRCSPARNFSIRLRALTASHLPAHPEASSTLSPRVLSVAAAYSRAWLAAAAASGYAAPAVNFRAY